MIDLDMRPTDALEMLQSRQEELYESVKRTIKPISLSRGDPFIVNDKDAVGDIALEEVPAYRLPHEAHGSLLPILKVRVHYPDTISRPRWRVKGAWMDGGLDVDRPVAGRRTASDGTQKYRIYTGRTAGQDLVAVAYQFCRGDFYRGERWPVRGIADNRSRSVIGEAVLLTALSQALDPHSLVRI